MWLYFILLLTSSVIVVSRGQHMPSMGSTDPFFIQEPENVTVIAGKRVMLKCVVGNSQERKVQWTQNDFGLGVDRKLNDWPHMRMVGAHPQSKFVSYYFKKFCLN